MIRTFSKTDVGKKRKNNQDYVYTVVKPVGNLPNLFAVADGMGGHRAGDYASRFTVQTLEKLISEDSRSTPETVIKDAISTVNEKLVLEAASDRDLQGMGTTLVVGTIMEDCLYVASIGDSRLYLINNTIKQITRDHSLVQEMVRIGEIRPEEARKHPDKNIITRAIGITEEADVDFFSVMLHPNDIILMCTDGLTNMVDDESIFETVQSSRDIVEMVEELIRLANRNGGKDNIGIVIVQFKGEETV